LRTVASECWGGHAVHAGFRLHLFEFEVIMKRLAVRLLLAPL
jgi:hypothetical protein